MVVMFLFDGKTPLDVIAKQQTLEPPELINIFNINLVLVFLTLSEIVLKNCKYITLKKYGCFFERILKRIRFYGVS